MHIKLLAALAALVAAGTVHAGHPVDVQWSVTIGNPQLGIVVGSPSYGRQVPAPQVYVPHAYAAPVYAAPYYAAPVYGRPAYVLPSHHAPQRQGWRDADRDGIPDRYDRVYNPRWDVDGDGIPNRHDRNYNPRRVEGPPQRHDDYGQPHGGYGGDAPRRGYERQPYPR